MRCIETGEDTVKTDNIDMINYNMRCIETGHLCHDSVIVIDKLQHEMY